MDNEYIIFGFLICLLVGLLFGVVVTVLVYESGDDIPFVLELPSNIQMPDNIETVDLRNETQINWLKIQLDLCARERNITKNDKII